MPEAHEAAENHHHERKVVIPDVVERRGVEDHRRVEHDDEERRKHAKPVNIGSAVCHGFFSFLVLALSGSGFTTDRTSSRTTVSRALASSTSEDAAVAGGRSQCRCTAQKTMVSRIRRAVVPRSPGLTR